MVVECGHIELNNGVRMPRFGLGTWLSKPGEVKAAVEAAIDAGYRHIDCAHCYENEHEVGAAIKKKIEEGVVSRGDLFITTKLWNTYHRPEVVEEGLEISLKDLGLDYVDLYLIHWPTAFFRNPEDKMNKFPNTPEKNIHMDDEAHYTDTWLALEKIYNAGKKVKAIGVSNFNNYQMQKVLDACSVKPAMNQIEISCYNPETEIVDFCQKNGVQVTAYSSLGAGARPAGLMKGQDVLLDDPTINALAQKYKKTAAHIALKWVAQRNIVVLPKSVTPARIVKNAEMFDFTIEDEDMKKLSELKPRHKYVCPDKFMPSKYFPFKADYSE